MVSQPVFERVVPDLAGVNVGSVEADHVPPIAGPVTGVLRTVQEVVDELAALLFVAVADENRELFGRGQLAGHVEVKPPREFFIGCEAGWLSLARGEAFLEQSVKACRGECGRLVSLGGSRRNLVGACPFLRGRNAFLLQ